MLDCEVKHLLLAPGQFKVLPSGIKVENTSNKIKRVVITVVAEEK